jgi:putative component of toxin-antitoxin plasmid stabilization module
MLVRVVGVYNVRKKKGSGFRGAGVYNIRKKKVWYVSVCWYALQENINKRKLLTIQVLIHIMGLGFRYALQEPLHGHSAL